MSKETLWGYEYNGGDLTKFAGKHLEIEAKIAEYYLHSFYNKQLKLFPGENLLDYCHILSVSAAPTSTQIVAEFFGDKGSKSIIQFLCPSSLACHVLTTTYTGQVPATLTTNQPAQGKKNNTNLESLHDYVRNGSSLDYLVRNKVALIPGTNFHRAGALLPFVGALLPGECIDHVLITSVTSVYQTAWSLLLDINMVGTMGSLTTKVLTLGDKITRDLFIPPSVPVITKLSKAASSIKIGNKIYKMKTKPTVPTMTLGQLKEKNKHSDKCVRCGKPIEELILGGFPMGKGCLNCESEMVNTKEIPF